ncbi:MAG: TIGR03986 family CRISPR-associated RAMP protein [Methanomicrobia archaeon]|nr:TIGR03986 family CRISPR-associated RAMP protein [Methanomicrobia archaeon]
MSFVNPYNFVRPGKAAKKEPPVWHHKFVGRSGKIVCTLKTLTPIFIPDSEVKEKEVGKGKYHKIMKFYRANGELRLPSTSLKGMARSVVEAASNSCFSQFEGGLLGKRELPENYDRHLPLTPGRILEIPSVNKLGYIMEMKSYKLPHNKFPQYKNKHGKNSQRVFIRVENDKVVRISDEENEECETVGYLKTSDVGIPGRKPKRNEHVFVEMGSKPFILEYTTYHDYIVSNKNNKHEHTKRPKAGDTIWFRARNRKIQEFGYAQIYRKPFGYSIQERLESISPDFLPCQNIHSLCPACRIFGTVTENPPEETEFKAFAGNISFSEGKLLPNQTVNTRSGILRILSSPSPTSFNFYLRDPENPEQVRNYDGQAIIDNRGKIDPSDVGKVVLRGRKFYWHHPYDKSLIKYFLTKEEIDDLKQRKQCHLTSTVELLQPSVEFEFAIEFENLKPEEIGILLWSLELEVGMAHKLGRGKPLGLGSVEINIKEFQIINRLKRYQEIFSDGVEDGNKKESISAFKHWLEKWNDNKPFDEIVNIKGLKSIMNLKNPPDDAVHYPRGGYQWFMYRKNEPLLNISDVERGKKQTR